MRIDVIEASFGPMRGNPIYLSLAGLEILNSYPDDMPPPS